MGQSIWVRQAGQPVGPFDEDELRQMAAEGRLRPDALLSLDQQRWRRASRVEGLFPAADPEHTPPPLPVKPAEPIVSETAPTDVLPVEVLEVDAPPVSQAVPPPASQAAPDIAPPPLSLTPALSSIPAPSLLAITAACDDLTPRLSPPRPIRHRFGPLVLAAIAGVAIGTVATGALWSLSGGGPRDGAAKTAQSTAKLPAPAANKPIDNQTVSLALIKATGRHHEVAHDKLPPNLSPPALVLDVPPPPSATDLVTEPAAPARESSNPRTLKQPEPPIIVASAQPATSPAMAAGGLAISGAPDPAVPKEAMPNAAMPGEAKAAPAKPDPAMPKQPPAGQGKLPAAQAPPLAVNANMGPPGMPAGPPPAVNDRGRRRALLLGNGGTPESEAAVEASLAWIAAHQLADGGWSFNHQVGACRERCPDPGFLAEARNGATAMALLPFLAAGYNHEEGPYKELLSAGLTYLISNQAPDGGLWEIGGTMYSHGLATIALCDAYNLSSEKPTVEEYAAAMTEAAKRGPKADKAAKAEAAKAAKADRAANAKIRLKPADAKGAVAAEGKPVTAEEYNSEAARAQRKLRTIRLGIAAQKALDYIVAAQNQTTGGWRYRPGDEGDTSVVGWQLMALKAGDMAQLIVPARAIAGASTFLDLVQSEYGSMYGYMSPIRGTPATTAIGLLARENLGWDQTNPSLIRGVEKLVMLGPSVGDPMTDDMYYNFYASQVLRNFGGPVWANWNPVMREYLVRTQATQGHMTGSWNFMGGHGAAKGGRLYNTALCTLILEVYYRHQPLYSLPKPVVSPGTNHNVPAQPQPK